MTKVDSLQDAYKVFLNVVNPLKNVPSTLLNQAFLTVMTASESEIIDLLRSRGVVSPPPVINSKIPEYAMKSSMFNQSKPADGPDTAEGFHNLISSITGGINPVINEDAPAVFQIFTKPKDKPIKKEYDASIGNYLLICSS